MQPSAGYNMDKPTDWLVFNQLLGKCLAQPSG